MSELEKRILSTFGRVLPKLSQRGQEKLLMIGEGMAIGVGVMKPEECTAVMGGEEDGSCKWNSECTGDSSD